MSFSAAPLRAALAAHSPPGATGLRAPLGGGWHLRPLLCVPQSELLGFGASIDGVGVSASGASIIDPMNEDLRFDRSYLRRRVWPQIESRWPGAASTLARTARHAADAQ